MRHPLFDGVTVATLRPEVQRECLNRFVHRMTVETRQRFPQFTDYMLASGYQLEAMTDAEWCQRTKVMVKKDGSLDERFHYCYTEMERTK